MFVSFWPGLSGECLVWEGNKEAHFPRFLPQILSRQPPSPDSQSHLISFSRILIFPRLLFQSHLSTSVIKIMEEKRDIYHTGTLTPESDSSKPIEQQLEYGSDAITPSPQYAQPPLFDAAATKRLLRKMDIRLLPFLALLYLYVPPYLTPYLPEGQKLMRLHRLSFLDRTNIGNARLFGLEADLRMSGLNYNTALAVFFPTYVLAEIPSNILLKKLTPAVWLTTIMVAWGAIVIGMGFVTNFSSLVACRALLGLAEGGLFPGVSYYITLWYPRHECGLRLALFFSAATAAGAFGGLLAAGK